MLFNMLKFEWKYFTRQPSFIVTCLVFFLLPFLAMVVDQVQIGAGGNVTKNSPFAITQILAILSIFAMFLVVNFIGNTATRNHTHKMSEIIGTKPLLPLSYNLGRFLGAYCVCITVFAMVPFGTWLGSLMPWVDAERIGPNHLHFYLTPFLILSTTTLFTLSAIFYAVAKRTNSLMIVYVVAIALFMFYNLSGLIFDQPDQRQMAALLDPFGFNTFTEFSRYWTIFEQNTLTVSLSEDILINRGVWLAIAVVILLIGGGFHKAQGLMAPRVSKKSAKNEQLDAVPSHFNIQHRAKKESQFDKFKARVVFEIKQIFSSPGFLILLVISLAQTLVIVLTQEGRHGQPFWPITRMMVDSIAGAFSLQMIIVVAYFTGETIWRERDTGMGDITDSTPTHNAVFWSSKLIAICTVLVVLMLLGIVCSVAIQFAKGYTNFEFGQYLIRLIYFEAYSFMLVAVLAFFFQAISPNKYIGIMIFAVYIIARMVFSNIGIEHNMFSYPRAPTLIYSDLNGYGDFLTARHWYTLYWTAFAVILGVLSYGLWSRGPASKLVERVRQLRYQIGCKGIIIMASALVVFIGAGSHIHYNTRVLNSFVGTEEGRDLQADYEKKYGEYRDDNFPIVTSVDADVAIYPEDRRVVAKANIMVENRGDSSITRFLISLPRHAKDANVIMTGGEIAERDTKFRSAWFELSEPLKPGERRKAVLESLIDHQGYKDRDEDFTVLANGTFINNVELFPYFGYNAGYQLVDRHDRRKRGLPEAQRAHKLEDKSRHKEHAFDRSMAFIDYKATLSTSRDQIAMTPGYLTKEWEEGDRRFFRYEMDTPMLNFFSITSGRYAVKKEDYNGISIEVYYHPSHYWNVDGMMQSTKDSLDYFQAEFGPYQHRQYRIIEFPRYRSFAQSFANTIPFAEGIWASDQRSPDDIDFVYFVNAHEMAHQWWGHQLGAANVQGSAVLSETLAEYSALAVMEKRFGKTKARHFLTYELDEYLRGRTSEILEENPLMRVENQAYIHYQKGSVVMMSIRHKIGEQRLNAAIKALLDEFRYKSTPYPTTMDLMRHLKQGASVQEQAFIDDHFQRITVFDLRAETADIEELDNGKFKITLAVNAKKFEADGKGQETEQSLQERVEVAAFIGNPNQFSAETRTVHISEVDISDGANIVEFIVDERPSHVGIDPFVRYIDRDTGNNILKL